MRLDDLDEDARLALDLLARAPANSVLLLPCGLDNAVRELEYHGLAEITMASDIPLASITPAGREAGEREAA